MSRASDGSAGDTNSNGGGGFLRQNNFVSNHKAHTFAHGTHPRQKLDSVHVPLRSMDNLEDCCRFCSNGSMA